MNLEQLGTLKKLISVVRIGYLTSTQTAFPGIADQNWRILLHQVLDQRYSDKFYKSMLEPSLEDVNKLRACL